MTILDQQDVSPEFIKVRWQEPYVSNALNRKAFKTTPRGIYRGFEIIPGPGDWEITVGGAASGTVSGYNGGAFDAASGWSIAVHESLQGYGTVIQQYGASGYIFDLTSHKGTDVFCALDVQYNLGFPTEAQVKICDSTELDNDPTLISLGRIIVPAVSAITEPNIVYDDALFPRILPYANVYKDGFMSKTQAEIVDLLSIPSASNAFEQEVVISSAGPQAILIPGGHRYVIGGYDLKCYKNGVRMIRGRDYTEIDDGDGWGSTVNWLTSLKVEDRVFFNGQKYAVALTNNLAVLDENALIQSGVTRLNFAGTGVLVLPDGTGRVKVIIPSVAGSGAKKQKLNVTGESIPPYKAVRVKTDGSIELFQPTDFTHRFFGITAQTIANEEFGDVFLDGVALYALSGVSGFSVGDYVYAAPSGEFVNAPPDPMLSQVVRIGIADCVEATSGYVATDIVFDRQSII